MSEPSTLIPAVQAAADAAGTLTCPAPQPAYFAEVNLLGPHGGDQGAEIIFARDSRPPEFVAPLVAEGKRRAAQLDEDIDEWAKTCPENTAWQRAAERVAALDHQHIRLDAALAKATEDLDTLLASGEPHSEPLAQLTRDPAELRDQLAAIDQALPALRSAVAVAACDLHDTIRRHASAAWADELAQIDEELGPLAPDETADQGWGRVLPAVVFRAETGAPVWPEMQARRIVEQILGHALPSRPLPAPTPAPRVAPAGWSLVGGAA